MYNRAVKRLGRLEKIPRPFSSESTGGEIFEKKFRSWFQKFKIVSVPEPVLFGTVPTPSPLPPRSERARKAFEIALSLKRSHCFRTKNGSWRTRWWTTCSSNRWWATGSAPARLRSTRWSARRRRAIGSSAPSTPCRVSVSSGTRRAPPLAVRHTSTSHRRPPLY